LRLDYLKERSFSVLLAKQTVRLSSGWTVNCPGRIYTYWISTTSWRTNGWCMVCCVGTKIEKRSEPIIQQRGFSVRKIRRN